MKRIALALLMVAQLGMTATGVNMTGVGVNLSGESHSDDVMPFTGWTAGTNCEDDDTGRDDSGGVCVDGGGRLWAQQNATIETGSNCLRGGGQCLKFDADVQAINPASVARDVMPDWNSTDLRGNAPHVDGHYYSAWYYFHGGSAGASSFDAPQSWWNLHAISNDSGDIAYLQVGSDNFWAAEAYDGSSFAWSNAETTGPETEDGGWIRIEIYVQADTSPEVEFTIFESDGSTTIATGDTSENGSGFIGSIDMLWSDSNGKGWMTDDSPEWPAPGTGQYWLVDDACSCTGTKAACIAGGCASMQTP